MKGAGGNFITYCLLLRCRLALKAFGRACLDEPTEWILIHREKPLEMGGL